MRAAILEGVKQMAVRERKRPEPKPDEVVIRVKSCGICGTDQHIYHGHPGSAEVTPPIVLGHELSGVVVDAGKQVTHLKPGDRVSVDPNIYCGHCRYCRSDRAHLCQNLEAVGVTRDGGMAEYCAVPAQNCYVLPDELSFDEGALVEPLGCVWHGLSRLTLSPSYRVLIIGGGFIGQLFLQLVHHAQVASVAVVEPVAEKHALLKRLGAHHVFRPSDRADMEAWKDGADVVIECVGKKETMEWAVSAAAKGGQVLLFGVAAPDTLISLSPYAVFSKELTIKGSFINPYTHDEAIALIRQKAIEVEPLISHRFALEELPAVMAQYPTLRVSKGVIRL